MGSFYAYAYALEMLKWKYGCKCRECELALKLIETTIQKIASGQYGEELPQNVVIWAVVHIYIYHAQDIWVLFVSIFIFCAFYQLDVENETCVASTNL